MGEGSEVGASTAPSRLQMHSGQTVRLGYREQGRVGWAWWHEMKLEMWRGQVTKGSVEIPPKGNRKPPDKTYIL